MEKFKKIAVIGALLLVVILGTNRMVSAFSPGFGMNEQHMGNNFKDSNNTRQHPSENREQHLNEMVEEGVISEEQANNMYDRMKRNQNSCHSYSSTNDTNHDNPSSESRQQMHGMMGGRR